jgi:hypothetical protein
MDEGFVTDADLANMSGEDGGTVAADREDRNVLEDKYGGDVDKLVNAYEALERKLGEQGNELGELRQRLETKHERKEVGEDELIEALEQKVQNGEISQLQAQRALHKFQASKLDERLSKSDQRTALAEERQIWQDWSAKQKDLQDNPALDNIMARIASKKPHLLVRNQGPKALQDSLETLLDLAKLEVQKAMDRRGGGLDDGRSRRVIRSNINSGRRSSQAGREAMERALQTDRDDDWGTALENSGLFD